MARHGKLEDTTIRGETKPGRYYDGDGLFLLVKRSARRADSGDAADIADEGQCCKTWVLRYEAPTRSAARCRRDMGLGRYPTVSLAHARRLALKARRLLVDGIDPLEARKQERAPRKSVPTFRQCAEEFIETRRPAWTNSKHAQQWENTLKTYAYGLIGSVVVSDIDTPMVTKVLRPIWGTKTETAARVRARVEAVLGYAKVNGWRAGENPAQWRGHLDKVFPARSKVQPVKHWQALSYRAVPELMVALSDLDGVAPLALQFAILTGLRTKEVLGARWSEFDADMRVWTVPARRMKGGKKEHKVPLCAAAQAVLGRMKEIEVSDYVFPGMKRGRPLSNMAMLMVLRRLECRDLVPHVTTHGFRSTIRDWAAEETDYSREVAELVLAHQISDKVEAAYRRGDLFEKRRRLMSDWGAFCSKRLFSNAVAHAEKAVDVAAILTVAAQ